MAREWCNEDVDGLLERGGDGRPGNLGVSTGVWMIDVVEISATVGDGKGDWTGDSFKCAGKSTIKGGRSGVPAWPSCSSSTCSFAFAMSIGATPESLIDSSKTVLAGDGGR